MGGTRAVPDAKSPARVSAAPSLALRTASAAIGCASAHHPGDSDDFAATATQHRMRLSVDGYKTAYVPLSLWDWDSSRSDKHCLRSKREGRGGGRKSIEKQ